ncbi:RING-H2 finger protein ATL1P [Hordeum vulgare]|uniref:RING-H2 finger protein ATL78-like n=1 Tax=Hordeum vulgare subsp. vulgare TaxID=112509 RepID=UPI001D1A4FA3|nr:RING-H2 finger protein ATL78-like [Hordeum vulgare subsp. vulgare]KAE8800761.1 RING-H2 finger protein ATL1P [Hordeum vulgare]
MSDFAAATAGLLVMRMVEATSSWFSVDPGPADPGCQFAVFVRCYVKRSLEFHGRGQPATVRHQPYIGPTNGSARKFLVKDLSVLQTDGGCRWALRRMLARMPQLGVLRLAEDEWDAVVPSNVVPQIVRVACGDGATRGFTFRFVLEVARKFVHDEQALLMACKERELAGSDSPDDCPICLEGLEGELAVQPPRCPHTFHRRCIFRWFCQAPTCPICRRDVRICALPEFLAL